MNDQIQPNEVPAQSNELGNPAERLPETTRGKIVEINSNPAIAQKRRIRHLEAMKGNTHNLRHGKNSKLHPLPPHLLEYMDYIDRLPFVTNQDVSEAMIKIIKSNLKRVALKEFLELSEGKDLDPELNKLNRDVFAMLSYVHQHPELLNQAPNTTPDLSGLDAEHLELLTNLGEALGKLSEPQLLLRKQLTPEANR